MTGGETRRRAACARGAETRFSSADRRATSRRAIAPLSRLPPPPSLASRLREISLASAAGDGEWSAGGGDHLLRAGGEPLLSGRLPPAPLPAPHLPVPHRLGRPLPPPPQCTSVLSPGLVVWDNLLLLSAFFLNCLPTLLYGCIVSYGTYVYFYPYW